MGTNEEDVLALLDKIDADLDKDLHEIAEKVVEEELEEEDDYDVDDYDLEPTYDPVKTAEEEAMMLLKRLELDDTNEELAAIKGELDENEKLNTLLNDYNGPELDFEAVKINIENGNYDAFILSMESMKNVNYQTEEDLNTLLHWAVSFRQTRMAKYLIDKGAFLLLNSTGSTPLDIANALRKEAPGDSEYRKLVDMLTERLNFQNYLTTLANN
eukprot:TRINITY_DN10954_c0_g1_i1.p1 TRINITY_DN10954_c0_g1~~TRINITY_DN10954_c0_g1_i1.p1  ORF type:complete len:242 (-),score=59.52 TRINITY_DN10954_c0_g1_i1:119-760(-)